MTRSLTRRCLWVALLIAAAAQAQAPRADRQFQNLIFGVPPGHLAAQVGQQGVVVAEEAALRNGKLRTYITLSASRPVAPELRALPAAAFCDALVRAVIEGELGADARMGTVEVVNDAARDGFDACQVAAKGRAGGQPKAVLYTITRARDRAALINLHALGDERGLIQGKPAFDQLLAATSFANLGHRTDGPPRPLPGDFAAQLDTVPKATPKALPPPRGSNCRQVSSQQCMSQMLGSFPNMTMSYQCLPVTQTVCD